MAEDETAPVCVVVMDVRFLVAVLETGRDGVLGHFVVGVFGHGAFCAGRRRGGGGEGAHT